MLDLQADHLPDMADEPKQREVRRSNGAIVSLTVVDIDPRRCRGNEIARVSIDVETADDSWSIVKARMYYVLRGAWVGSPSSSEVEPRTEALLYDPLVQDVLVAEVSMRLLGRLLPRKPRRNETAPDAAALHRDVIATIATRWGGGT